MTDPARKRRIIRTSIVLAVPIGLFAGCLSFDLIQMSAARPPHNLKTIQDFQTWKGAAIMGKGTFEDSGTTYTVMLAPAGRSLASGPSAYLFDPKGQFVDWTSDMGDCRTIQKRFDLSSGHVKISGHRTP